ncbi:MAG: ATP-binding cassette domain-containing protein, partial [Candidatus Marinimicrobia bacterium]|nr:ATP-binding cassette domain-containing protein [Candidatus Neomarinimicrobiota bacterium]
MPNKLFQNLKEYIFTFRFSFRAFRLVWSTSKGLTVLLGLLTLIAGVLPAGIAYVGKLIVDAVVAAIDSGLAADRQQALIYIGYEAVLVILMAAVQKGIQIVQSLMRVLMGQQVNVMILEKALTLDLTHFEDSEFYDKMTRARREASSRPLSLITGVFGLVQNGITLVTYGGLLLQFSGLAVVILILASIPAFIVEAKFSGEAFRLFSWRVPEARQQNYYEWILTREDYAKEIKLFQIGKLFIKRYRDIFQKLFTEDKSLTLRRGFWGYTLGVISTLAFYGTYGWIAWATIAGAITLGSMTMYVMVFKQGQSAIAASLSSIGSMYEDNLYLSTLYDYLDQEVTRPEGIAEQGTKQEDGIRFENVSFTYPGTERPAVENITFHLKPGQKLALVGSNGSGKTTLIKLLTRLYEPTGGRILLDGLDLREWDIDALRSRISVIFQDFSRYQLIVGENIGVGDVNHLSDEEHWEDSAVKGMAAPFVEQLESGYHTQLGRWFANGKELSGGEWQKIALSRAFMKSNS